jgi:hypothetical protein
MDSEDEPETVPSQNSAEDLIEIAKPKGIGYGDDANHHRVNTAENSSQN